MSLENEDLQTQRFCVCISATGSGVGCRPRAARVFCESWVTFPVREPDHGRGGRGWGRLRSLCAPLTGCCAPCWGRGEQVSLPGGHSLGTMSGRDRQPHRVPGLPHSHLTVGAPLGRGGNRGSESLSDLSPRSHVAELGFILGLWSQGFLLSPPHDRERAGSPRRGEPGVTQA